MFKRRGFSDKLYFLNFIIVWSFVGVCVILTILSGYVGINDLSVVGTGIPAAFAELGIHTGFIVWKAKTENMRKWKDKEALKRLEDELEVMDL